LATIQVSAEDIVAQPIHLCDARLAHYLRLFSGQFSLPQWKYFVTVLLGLVQCDERRTLSALLRHVAAHMTISGLCFFLRAAPWSVADLTAVRQVHFYQQVAAVVAEDHAQQRAQRERRAGRPKPTVVTGYLIQDDSTHMKRYARAQAGLGQHDSGTEKKVVKGHSLFQSVYVLEGQQLPLTPRLYRQKVTCLAEAVSFVSKIDLAAQEITTFEPAPDTQTHVLTDSWYAARRIWQAARQRDWDITCGLKSNRPMRLLQPDGTRRWPSVRQYAASLPADAFTAVTWPRQDGEKVVYAHLVKTWVRKLGPCQVLITKLHPDDPVDQCYYWATSRMDDTLEQVIAHVAQRWTIEVLFADFKELLGSDHYQLRSAQGLLRFWALGLCLYQFLDEVRVAHRRLWGEALTLGQARQQIRESHQTALLDWILDQAEVGVSRTEIGRALQPAMQL
jgi:hypothetical protein